MFTVLKVKKNYNNKLFLSVSKLLYTFSSIIHVSKRCHYNHIYFMSNSYLHDFVFVRF